MLRKIAIKLSYTLILMVVSWPVLAHNKVVVIPLSGSDAPTSKIIFITNETMAANIAFTTIILGSIVVLISGAQIADGICQSAADADGSKVKGKVFRAWLSGDLAAGYRAGRTFKRSSVPYIRVDGAQIADNYEDLINPDTELSVPIVNSAAGELILGDVWTGVLDDGRESISNCNNWTSAESTDLGRNGISLFKDGRWSSNESSECDELKHLYCVEQ